jgi:hypothetical protein
MERVLDRVNLFAALKRVTQNKGSAGIDGMHLDELPTYLKVHWPRTRQELLEGCNKPQPVERMLIPKPGGGERQLGIPTVLDRLIQQALLQVIQPEWDRSFSHSSYGFRPVRSAHQAIQVDSLMTDSDPFFLVQPVIDLFVTPGLVEKRFEPVPVCRADSGLMPVWRRLSASFWACLDRYPRWPWLRLSSRLMVD